jgi:hypothetical protein
MPAPSARPPPRRLYLVGPEGCGPHRWGKTFLCAACWREAFDAWWAEVLGPSNR